MKIKKPETLSHHLEKPVLRRQFSRQLLQGLGSRAFDHWFGHEQSPDHSTPIVPAEVVCKIAPSERIKR